MSATAVGAGRLEGTAAVGHTRRGRPTDDWRMPALAGAGALRSSVADLLIFLGAHLRPDGDALAVPLQMVMEPRRAAGRNLQVALGWFVLERRQASPLWWHNGGTGGFLSFVGMDREAHTAVVVLSNSSRSVNRIGSDLLQSPPA